MNQVATLDEARKSDQEFDTQFANGKLLFADLSKTSVEGLLGSEFPFSGIKRVETILEETAIHSDSPHRRSLAFSMLLGEASGLFAALEENPSERAKKMMIGLVAGLERIASQTPDPNLLIIGNDSSLANTMLYTESTWVPTPERVNSLRDKLPFREGVAMLLSHRVINRLAMRSPEMKKVITVHRNNMKKMMPQTFSTFPGEALAAWEKQESVQ